MFACLHAPGNLPLLLECAAHFSPLIEETSPDSTVFDIRGLDRICGTPEQIAGEMQRRVGIPANLALASNPDAAFHAARGIPGTTILPAGKEAATLAPLPVWLLGGPPDFAYTLNLWGIRTFGEFAALPPLGISARLGEAGLHMQQLARGSGCRQLLARTEPLIFSQEQELEDSIEALEPLLFVVSGMLKELCERLRFHARSTNEIRLRLKLERAPVHVTTLQLPVPLLDSKVFLKLLQLELQEKSPKASVERVYLRLMPVEPRTTQHGLFLPSSPEPERLEITLSRIRKLVGEGNVGTPELLNSHRPDAVRMTALRPVPGEVSVFRPKMALRRFRPPCPAQVWCTGRGVPVRILSSLGEGRVLACAGPWQTSGEWWAAEAWDHEEWDVEVFEIGVSRIYQDHLKMRWFIEGSYD